MSHWSRQSSRTPALGAATFTLRSATSAAPADVGPRPGRLLGAFCLAATAHCAPGSAQDHIIDWALSESLTNSSGITDRDEGHMLAGFGHGSSVVIGQYTGQGTVDATLGRTGANETTLPAGNTYNGYIARYEGSGALRWAGAVAAAYLPSMDANQDGNRVAACADGATYVSVGGAGQSSAAHRISFVAADGTATVAPLPAYTKADGTHRVGALARYSATGAVEWAKVLSSSANLVYLDGIAARSDSSVVAVGKFLGTLDLGGTVTLTSQPTASTWNTFVARFSATCATLWARRVSGNMLQRPLNVPSPLSYVGVACDDSIRISDVLDGTGNTADFGTFTLIPPSGIFRPRYLAKVTPDGTFEWATTAMSYGDFAFDLDVAADGSVVLGGYGYISTPFVFGPGRACEASIASAVHGNNDAWAARWAADGALQWVRKLQDSNYASGLGIAALPDGKTVLPGAFSGAVSAGATSVSAGRGFLMQFDGAGLVTWLTELTGRTVATPHDVDASPDGSLFAVGTHWGGAVTATGDNGTATTNATPEVRYDMFLVKWSFGAGPPIADACLDQSVPECQTGVMLDGSASCDPGGGALSFAWLQSAGPPVTLSDAAAAQPTLTAPIVALGNETLTFNLTVTARGVSAADTVDVDVVNVSHPPVADAGDDQSVAEGAPVTLDGGDSFDVDGDGFSYTWVQVAGTPTVTLIGASTANPTFVALFVGAGGADLTFELTVDDGYGGTATDTVVVHVQNAIDPPLADAARPTTELLWPPNHDMVAVGITGVSDPNGNATITIDHVTQDEPTDGTGDGDTAVDAVIHPDGTVLLRAERAGNGDGRVYRIHFTASDLEGSSSGSVLVTVPTKKKDTAVDSGQSHDSTN